MTKGTLERVEEEIAFERIASYCHFLSREERENGEPGGKTLSKFLRPSLFHVRETKREGTTIKDTFVLLLKRAGV